MIKITYAPHVTQSKDCCLMSRKLVLIDKFLKIGE